MLKFKGLGVAMVTPFTSKNEVDYPAISRLVEHLIVGNVSYIVLLGTTAESVTLSEAEKQELVNFVVKQNNKRVPLVVGMGGNNTTELVKALHRFDLSGADGILSVTPYYNKPTQKGLELHYKTIAAETELPIILYNVPGRTGVNMTAQTTLKLANEVKNIVAVKEASGDLNQQSYILRDRPDDFLVLSGDDGLILPQIAMGLDGVISVVGNAFPKEFSLLIKYVQGNNLSQAQAIHYKFTEIIDNLFVEGNPGGVKAALHILGIIDNNLRLPLAPVSDKTYGKLNELIRLL
ncbi:MAG TPA: 4-hydroxy-tetrahydrodipicolinate synthase [Perlabentimonas sp.]|jgi:4-hydroxy-tetrahydrodipicolinate synthase|nr:4-hydroxy-tetrahydrodipicolinate synthase [Bacteroidales bacterium]MDD4672281.1 4-hydroxy-tetrahydrodipicolinate synthase [Bacteroidales bacterium]MDY0347420.1 4-hydroxy-tetrahydrodipicolinate synthase [Tenuifilaceae bacterium]HZJ73576.1 4-hydroxy-tetrahydrodipicolinate synthase [Perlabentimonas sp.]